MPSCIVAIGSGGVGVACAARVRRLEAVREVVVRVGWQCAAEGPVDLIGPDDSADEVDRDGVRLLLRAIFTAAGGSHDDWDTYDRLMADERRTAVLFTPQRIYANG